MRSSHFAAAWVGAWLLAGLATPGHAQGPTAHGAKPPVRPLHQRIADADRVAVATVERVTLGRVSVRDAQTLRGRPVARFEVKRAPSAAPEVVAGERLLLVLMGARSPYVWAERPDEVLVLESEGAAAELARVVDADSQDATRAAYLDWLDGTDDGLREEAVRGLGDPAVGGVGVPAEVGVARAGIALDATRPPAVRLASARVATIRPEGRRALLEAVARGDASADVARLAIGTSALARDPDLRDAVLAALDDDDPTLRRTAVSAALTLPGDDAVRRRLARVAADDPDPEVRRRAAAVLARLERNAGG